MSDGVSVLQAVFVGVYVAERNGGQAVTREEKPFFVRLDCHGPHFPSVIPESVQGTSFLPLCRGEDQERKPYVGIEFHGSHMGLYSIRGLRTAEYHYNYQVGDRDELYDVVNDPYETTNLIDDPKYAEYVVHYLTHDPECYLKAPGRGRTNW